MQDMTGSFHIGGIRLHIWTVSTHSNAVSQHNRPSCFRYVLLWGTVFSVKPSYFCKSKYTGLVCFTVSRCVFLFVWLYTDDCALQYVIFLWAVQCVSLYLEASDLHQLLFHRLWTTEANGCCFLWLTVCASGFSSLLNNRRAKGQIGECVESGGERRVQRLRGSEETNQKKSSSAVLSLWMV